jgi:hypothetical protein
MASSLERRLVSAVTADDIQRAFEDPAIDHVIVWRPGTVVEKDGLYYRVTAHGCWEFIGAGWRGEARCV